MNFQQTLPRTDPADLDAASALGLLLASALNHTATVQQCCPRCCWNCRALNFYRQDNPTVVAIAVTAALGRTINFHRPDGSINWDAVTLIWPPDGQHLPDCAATLNRT